MDWIFNGIGTAMLTFILGIVFGVAGNRLYINKQTQKAGKKSVQIQGNETVKDNKFAKKISEKNMPSGDYVNGDKIVNDSFDEFDTRNFPHYNTTQIEYVIANGNDATRRKWCFELIANQKQEHLISKCIKEMNNDKEKYNLLEVLSKHNFQDSEYFAMIGRSLSNGIYIAKAIKLYISIDKPKYIETAFTLLENNKYIYESLIDIYEYDKDIFTKLYDNGNCFDNQKYKEKMLCFLKENEG